MPSPTASPRAHSPETAIRSVVNATIPSLPPAGSASAPPGALPPFPAVSPSVQNIEDQLSVFCDICSFSHPRSQPCDPDDLARHRVFLSAIENQKSTIENPKGGPRTPEGKARSRLNALKHGLTATLPVILPGEDPAERQALLDSLTRDFKPANEVERILVQRLTHLAWQLRRLPAAEAEILRQLNEQHRLEIEDQNTINRRQHMHSSDETQQQNEPTPLPITDATPAQLLADQFLSADDKSNPLARLQRYESTIQRLLRQGPQQPHQAPIRPRTKRTGLTEPTHAADRTQLPNRTQIAERTRRHLSFEI